MLRTVTCGNIYDKYIGLTVTLCGWVQNIRNKGGIVWIDLRDRYGIAQIVLDSSIVSPDLLNLSKTLGREYVISVTGTVIERSNKNPNMATGDVEVQPMDIKILNPSVLPPFIIEDITDAHEDLRMRYRYLDIRRNPIRKNLELRHKVMQITRNYLDTNLFMEVETPVLIKSTPEGARDFLVPSRMNQGQFYALPQSPQTFKQLLMVGGIDRYFQIVKCFRDESLRSDRQLEFTQIDCEMSFVEQEDILNLFEGLIQTIFNKIHIITFNKFDRITYKDAMYHYGNDKPDLRFDMKFKHLKEMFNNPDFKLFDNAESIIGIIAENKSFSRKELDELSDFIKIPLVNIKFSEDGTIKSSADKYFTQQDLLPVVEFTGMKKGDTLLIAAGTLNTVTKKMSELRLLLGKRLNLIDNSNYYPLWVTDFPLFEWNEEDQRWYAMHHPFTSPNADDIELLKSDNIENVRANAYDLVINGVEIGGGSIRIHNKELQQLMFNKLGFTPEEANEQFGFLMNAFEFGAPPHGGLAFGLDRLCAMLGETDNIRDYIAFPKNNNGRDTMIDTPSEVSALQLKELGIKI